MFRSNWTTFSVLSVLLAGLTACSGREPDPGLDPDPGPAANPFTVRQVAPELRADVDEVARGANQFAFDLYAKIRDTSENLILSPYSIYEALAMTSAGAAGVTEAEMAAVLHAEGDRATFQDACGAILSSLDRGSDLGGYSLYIANRLWGQAGFAFRDDFLGLLRDVHEAPLEQLDFKADPEACRKTINAWVEGATHDRIADLLPPGSIDSSTRLVLTNAIWFKGTWEISFDPELTRAAPFHVSPDRTVSVNMMSGTEERRVGFHDGIQALDLPYSGEDLSMLLLLPPPGKDIADLETQLDPELLDAITASLETQEIEVALPRFQFTAEFGLIPALASMGMPSAFDPAAADLSRMDGRRDLYISQVRHKAFIKVDETGTEAAGATSVGISVTSLPSSLRFDRPFVFVIQDHVTGAILFMGRVQDPS